MCCLCDCDKTKYFFDSYNVVITYVEHFESKFKKSACRQHLNIFFANFVMLSALI
jgi:hypothetical protein